MAGKKYSDILKISNTAVLANSDIFVLERADGNTYAFQANAFYSYISSVVLTEQRSIKEIDTAITYSAAETDDVILCDTVSAGANITIAFPDMPENGKEYTIKLTNTSGSVVVITTTNTEIATVEAALGGSVANTTSLTSIGEVATWTHYNGVYRKIG